MIFITQKQQKIEERDFYYAEAIKECGAWFLLRRSIQRVWSM